MLKRSTPGPSNTIRNQWQHLQPDPGPTTDASRIAYQRMPHHAGAHMGRTRRAGRCASPARLGAWLAFNSTAHCRAAELLAAADAEQAHLDPQQHLRAGRHGEWMAETLQVSSRTAAPGNVWGVSLVPTGYSEEQHPDLAAIIKNQNKR